MSDPKPDAWRKIVEALADGEAVDWDHWSRVAHFSPSEVRVLRGIETIRLARGVAEKSPSDPEAEALPLESGFEILEEIGRGSYGRVYRAIDRALGREVALKVILEDHPASSTARSRFIREARLLASVDHPNIVRIHSIDEKDGRLRLSLERIPGRTLGQVLEESGPLSPDEAARVGIDLCRALSAIHAKGLVHRDLKPANVMRATGGRIVLLDFGVARSSLGESSETTAGHEGTPLFMAPEQLDSAHRAGPSADLFALGVLLYWMVSGRYPFEADSLADLRKRLVEGHPTPLSDRVPDVPRAYAAIVSRAIKTDSDGRFESAGELEEALRAFLAEGERADLGAVASGRRPRVTRQRLVVAGAGAAFLGLFAVVGLPRLAAPASFEFEAQMVARRDGADVPLRPGDVVHPGDGLVLDVRASRDVYVYVFNEDAEGVMTALFPIRGFEPSNPIPGGGSSRLPGSFDGEPHRWRVSTLGGGRECFAIVASRSPVKAAEALLGQVPEARMGSGLPVNAQAKAELLRSVSSLEPDEPETAEAPARAGGNRLEGLIENLEGGAIRGNGILWRKICLENRPD